MANVLKQGDKGSEVLDLQKRLQNVGYTLEADGDFGPATDKVVKEFQSRYGLTPDGIVGKITRNQLIRFSSDTKQDFIEDKGEAKLELKRYIKNKKNTIGDLYLNGEFFAFTLEDPIRSGEDGVLQKDEKVYGDTAIPDGKYQIVVDRSSRFKRDMPRLLNVPHFEGVRIHGGNTNEDTHGCPLVAKNTDGNKIWGSMEKPLTKELKKYSKIEIIITDCFDGSYTGKWTG